MVKTKRQIISKSLQNNVSYNGTNARKFITVHQTGNTTKGANAQMHANLQSNGNSRLAGWQWQVDDKIAIQSIPHTTQAYHAGNKKGNQESIGVEHCVNSDADYNKVLQNGAELVAQIMKDENIPLSNVVTHGYWSGKHCPAQLLNGKNGITWAKYKEMVQKAYNGKKPSIQPEQSSSKPTSTPYAGSIVDYLNQQGIKSNINNRKNLAVEYGIVDNESQYTGTAKQNTALLNAMMKGEPKQEGTRKEPIQSGYTGNSIVDYLASIKVDNSFNSRKRLAKQYLGINNYSGTAKQNKDLLNAMRGVSGGSSGASLAVDGYLGPDLVKVLQDYYGLVVDGEIWGQYKGNQATKAFNQKAVKYDKGGSPVVRALQRTIGVTADGIWGADTTRALQRYLGTPVDGIISRPSTAIKELQRRLNKGTF